MIVSDDGFWVESGGSLQYGVPREATNMNVVPLDQLLPYSSRSVTVAFAYAYNRGEHRIRRAFLFVACHILD